MLSVVSLLSFLWFANSITLVAVNPKLHLLAWLQGVSGALALLLALGLLLSAAARAGAQRLAGLLSQQAWLGLLASLGMAVLAFSAAAAVGPASRILPLAQLVGVWAAGLAALAAAARLQQAWPQHGERMGYQLRIWAIAFLPVLTTSLIVAALFQKPMMDYMPFNKDEMFYWHQSKTFSVVGFGGGYYTAFELPAGAAFTHFGSHGFMLPLVFGSLGKLFGWGAHSLVLFNHLLVAAALMIFVRVLQPQRADLPWLALLVATYTPLVYFVGTSWSEGLQLSLSILLASLFILMIKRPRTRWRWAALLVVYLCVLARPTWAVLLPPALYFCTPGLRPRVRLGLAMTLGLVLALFAYRSWGYFASPYPITLPYYESNVLLNLRSTWDTVMAMLSTNLHTFANYSLFEMMGATAWSVVLLLLFLLGRLVVLARRGLRAGQTLQAALQQQETFIFLTYLLSAILPFLLCFLPLIGRGERYFGGFLLFATLILFFMQQKKLVGAIVLVQVAALAGMLAYYQATVRPNYLTPHSAEEFESMRVASEDFLVYDASLQPWCNSLLTENIFQTYTHVPAGIGIASKFEDDDVAWYTTPFKSRYILLDRKMEGQNWLWLADTPYGGLYLNQDADCPPLSP